MLCPLLLSPLILSNTCNAEVVWSEDFEDGDLEGWWIAQGNFSVEDGTLRSTVEESFQKVMFLSVIWHPSTVAVGTWSWDWMFDSPNDSPEIVVDFMSMTQHTFVMNSRGKNYGIYAGHLDENEFVLYADDKWYIGEIFYERYMSIAATKKNKWHHIDVTRNEDGLIRFYADGVLAIELTNNRYTESVAFGVMLEHSWRGDGVIDNIVVSDTIDIDPSTAVEEEKQQGIPGFPIESILTGLIAGASIIWLIQRRR
jgi:hypothetical protein